MSTLDVWRFALAAAFSFSLLFAACSVAVALFPDGTVDFFNNWFHGLDLRLLRPPGGRPVTAGQFASGLAGVVVVAFGVGAALAAFYNLLARRRRP